MDKYLAEGGIGLLLAWVLIKDVIKPLIEGRNGKAPVVNKMSFGDHDKICDRRLDDVKEIFDTKLDTVNVKLDSIHNDVKALKK